MKITTFAICGLAAFTILVITSQYRAYLAERRCMLLTIQIEAVKKQAYETGKDDGILLGLEQMARSNIFQGPLVITNDNVTIIGCWFVVVNTNNEPLITVSNNNRPLVPQQRTPPNKVRRHAP